MATDRQRDLAEAIVLNIKKPRSKQKNKTELLESIGYASTTALHEQKVIIEAKGVQEELKKLGFDSNNAKRVIGEILDKKDAKDADKIKAAEVVFKVNDDYAPEKSISVSVEMSPKQLELAKQIHAIRGGHKGSEADL